MKNKTIEELEKNKADIELEIKRRKRRKAQKGLFKDCKTKIGQCYRFRNRYSGETEYWYIYAIVKDVVLEGSSVYMILDKYEKTKDNEIKISINKRELETVRPMHCWDWIKKEVFEEEKDKIINQLTL